MWSAKKTNVTKDSGILSVTIEFTNGAETFSEVVKMKYVDDTYISDYVARRIDELTKIDKVASDLVSVVDIVPTPKVEKTVPHLTADEITKNTYRDHLLKYKSLLKGVELGIIDPKDATLAQEKAYCVSNYLPTYSDILLF